MHADQATAHMFIVNPLFGGGLKTFFNTSAHRGENRSARAHGRAIMPADVPTTRCQAIIHFRARYSEAVLVIVCPITLKIPPNPPLLRGDCIFLCLPPFLKGGGGGFSPV